MSISLAHRLAAVATGAVLGLGLLAPVAGRAATPMQNGCRAVAPSTVSCKYVARGNGRWLSATDSPWVITVLHGGRLRAVAYRPHQAMGEPASTSTFLAVAGDVVTVRFDSMIATGMLWAGDA
jgi:hypothetical protein